MLILEMPGTGASLQQFEPLRVDYAAPEAGGRLGGVQAGFPLWAATWNLGKIGARRSDLWRAFAARMRGQQRRLYGRDLARPYPLAHICGFSRMTKTDGTPFVGAASSWSQAIDANGNAVLTLHGLPSGLILSVGDYCDFRWTATSAELGGAEWRDLARVSAAADGSIGDEGFVAMADAAGTIAVMVEPPISGVVPSDAAAHLDRPACIMALTAQSKLGAIDLRLAVRDGMIDAIQDLRP